MYTIKGKWSIEGIFEGSVFENDKKFGTVNRVIMGQTDIGQWIYKIHWKSSLNKDAIRDRFKRWLKDSKISSAEFFTKQIIEYIDNNPKHREFLVDN